MFYERKCKERMGRQNYCHSGNDWLRNILHHAFIAEHDLHIDKERLR